MLTGTVIKCSDKQLPAVFCQLFHQSCSLKNKGARIKNSFPQLSFQNNFTNILNNILEKQYNCDPYAEIKNYLKDNACGSHSAISTFIKIFCIDKRTAKSIVLKYPVFSEFPKKRIVDSFLLLRNAGMSLSVIQRNVKLLTQDMDILKKKIVIIQKIVEHLDNGTEFFYQNLNCLDTFINLFAKINNTVTIKYFEELQIPNEELYKLLSKYLPIIIYEPDQTAKNFKLLIHHGVSIESLTKHKWLIYLSYDLTKRRLDTLSESGLLPIENPSILKYKDDIWNKKINILKTNQLQSEQISLVVDYLCEKSGYSKILIRNKIFQIKKFVNNLDKVKRKVDLIIKEGYEYHDIVWSIRVLSRSEDLIINRFSTLQGISCNDQLLNVLLLPEKKFLDYVNSKINKKQE